jgi:hypothetical protein
MTPSFWTPIELTQTLVCVGVVIQSAELLAQNRLYAPGGLYDWNVLSTMAAWTKFGRRGAALKAMMRHQSFVTLTAIQLITALALFGVTPGYWRAPMIGVLLACHLMFLLRSPFGLDGSDQMMLIVLAALFAYRLHPTPAMQAIAFGFVAGQLALSYITAGVAKAVSPTWRGGKAIEGILATNSYGSRRLARAFLDHRWAAVALCWSVILFECCGPPLAYLHPMVGAAFLACGFLFHLSIAFSMGLNIFFWSFIATYPAVWWCISRLAPFGA